MQNTKIAIIGLGYVGLPLAVEFGKLYPTVGFDIDQERVDELSKGHDRTLEVTDDYLQEVIKSSTKQAGISFSTQAAAMADCNYFIVTVPTPTDKNNHPVLTPLIKASETIGKLLKKGDIVIYESTVYPGLTEEECVPVLEQVSGLKYNSDFFVGYSPERINPGDKEHTLTKILKVTSGSTPEVADKVDQLYQSVIVAGTHKAPSIKVAEAAKVIENSQRDINIAFVNELAKIFEHLDIDTQAVLEAAGTKWNFLPFKPGLVGGHCIGVDPYYLAQKAQEAGYNPEIILAGRRMNDGMGAWVASQIVKLMIKKGQTVSQSSILCLGVTFKENCPDIRNTKAIDVINELADYGCTVDVYDPWADKAEVKHEYGLELINSYSIQAYDAIVLNVAHNEFKTLDVASLKKGDNTVVYDIKAVWDEDLVDGRL
ncbi:nucleotide sugar dehydrogenase [Carboxylicivirga sp. M1479]|uniref:nucleotide sugar dehydrogenase n=1 Tax=Carboxylicivirga sp. M1479 TaxID=2594476 RepID=UPI0011778280|nr:nucleotide sugar dehydrogenase [Carboxylicivirga sp. M1479]TRX70533.1 nucleotide sugar dehydrogenase [Carboxylicivirga sp. M1479]